MTEVIVYQATAEQVQAAYNFSVIPQPAKKNGFVLRASSVLLKVAQGLALSGFALIIYSYAPSVWYGAQSLVAKSVSSFNLSSSEVQNLKADSIIHKAVYEPSFDPKLPVVNHFSIPSIGVETDIQEAALDSYEEALIKGVWRVSDFGAPTSGDKPTILAAHRFGYLAWTNSFRHKSSFYNLPKVKVGDVINVVWRQRKYVYEVYATDKGIEIGDYSADLILYTCEKLNGPERVFVYARLLQV